MKNLNKFVLFLLIVSGINWGTWSLFEFNFIYYIFGKEWIDRVIYFIFGVSGVYFAFLWKYWTNLKREPAPAKRRAKRRKPVAKKAKIRRKRRKVVAKSR